jgi:hypothetical protein
MRELTYKQVNARLNSHLIPVKKAFQAANNRKSPFPIIFHKKDLGNGNFILYRFKKRNKKFYSANGSNVPLAPPFM